MPRLSLFFLLVLTACASTGAERPLPPPSADVIEASTQPRNRADVLTPEEIEAATSASNAHQLVSLLRPNWLRLRGNPDHPDPDGSRVIQVWYNGRNMGDVSMLRDISRGQIISMRWVDPITARATYGPPNGRGVIAINGR